MLINQVRAIRNQHPSKIGTGSVQIQVYRRVRESIYGQASFAVSWLQQKGFGFNESPMSAALPVGILEAKMSPHPYLLMKSL